MRRLAAILLLATSSYAQDAPPKPVGPAEVFRDVALTPRSVSVKSHVLELGSVRYTLSGLLTEMAGKDGAFAGFFFEGTGTLAFPLEDTVTARVFGDNAKRLGGFEVGPKELVARFGRASFWLSEAARPAIEGLAAGPAEELQRVAGHRARFAKDRFPDPEPALAAARLDRRRYAQALVEGSGRDLRHEVDDLFGDSETLAVVNTMEGAPAGFVDWRFSREVASRPLGRARHTAPRVDVRLVDLDVDIREMPQTGWGELVVKETLVPARPMRALCLTLKSAVLGSRGLSDAAAHMESVKGADGRALPFLFEKDRVVVFLPEEAPAGKPLTVTFEYAAPYFGRPGGDNTWELELGESWYPTPREARASCLFTYHAVVRARKPFTAFTSGDTVRRAEEGEYNLLETRLARPVPMVGALGGTYTLQEEKQDGYTCRVASYAVKKERSGAKLIALFHAVRKYYEQYFGPFPWKEYTIVEINSFGYGQAPPGMMRITHEAFQMNIFGDPRAELFSQGINERIAHEMAHAWWGGVVWGASDEEQWIEESFAEVSAGRVIEELKSKGEFKQLTNVWRTRASDAKSLAPIWLANAMADKASLQPSHTSTQDRFYLVYFKGAVLLQEIRKEVGDDVFFTVLKSFLRSFEKRPAVTTEQFIGLLSYVTKKEWKPFFEKYYLGLEMP